VLSTSGAVRPVYHVQPGAASTCFTIALSALHLVRDGDLQRLHRCRDDCCVLLLYDTTRSATRRCCSLGGMDRARSAKRYLAAKQRSRSSLHASRFGHYTVVTKRCVNAVKR
jgi:predicted RNA-binding Zn ribbon-like protein